MNQGGKNRIAFAKPYMDEEEADAAAEVIRSGWIVNGSKLEQFEEQFASICHAKYAIGMSSWTSAAFLLLKALGIGPGDEVLVPSFTFIASVNVIVHTGATPVFVDIDEETLNISMNDLMGKISPKTKVILAVDQLGFPCDWVAINNLASENDLIVVQDAACSFGATLHGKGMGATCEHSIFSLHARKVISTAEGGVVCTNDQDLAQRLRRLRQQGMTISDFQRHDMPPTAFERYDEVGYNFRITDIQAAIGLVQLRKLHKILSRRREIAQYYNSRLQACSCIQQVKVVNGAVPNWQSYSVTLTGHLAESRNAIMTELAEKGIPSRRGVMATHLEAPYAQEHIKLPATEKVSANSLLLPIHPALSLEDCKYIVDTFLEILER